jgi:hypothetical protein
MAKRIPKDEYFHKRYKEALKNGRTEKAAYYEARLKEMGVFEKFTKDVKTQTRERIAKMSSAERVRRAAEILAETKSGMSQQAKQAYLLDAGLTSTEYLEALNLASGGELLRTALS